MKNVILCIVLLAYTSLLHAQTSPGVEAIATYQTASILKRSTINNSYAAAYQYNSAEEKCNKYRRMKIAGIIVTSLGAGMLISGATLIGIGVHSVTYDSFGMPYNNTIYIIGGAAMVVLSVAPLAAGIPLTVVGTVKGKRYCHGGDGNKHDYTKEREGAYLELESGNNGLGLALKF